MAFKDYRHSVHPAHLLYLDGSLGLKIPLQVGRTLGVRVLLGMGHMEEMGGAYSSFNGLV